MPDDITHERWKMGLGVLWTPMKEFGFYYSSSFGVKRNKQDKLREVYFINGLKKEKEQKRF